MGSDYSNRRQAERFSLTWPARLLLPNKRIISVKTKDISTGGIGFESSEEVPTDTVVGVELKPWSSGRPSLIRCKGVIVYSVMQANGLGYFQGLSFTDFPRQQFDILVEILANLEQK